MKKLYWQSHRLSRFTLLFICLLAFASILSVEQFKTNVPQSFYNQKLAAVLLTEQSMVAIKSARLKKRIAIDVENDPLRSGLIGQSFNFLTVGQGTLSARQTTINPNIAALIISWFKQIKLKRGDTIAISMDGSYPALNIAVLAAVKTLELKPIIIVNAAATQWGANIPGLLWLDMMNILNKRELLPYMPVAASLGGSKAKSHSMTPRLTEYYLTSIKKYNIPLIEAKTATDSIEQRMKIFADQAHGANIAAFINIGTYAAVYQQSNKKHKTLKPGLNLSINVAAAVGDSVMVRFIKNGVPVINLNKINRIAEKFNLPRAPTTKPRLGEGNIFFEKHYNPYLALGYLIAILAFLIITTALNKSRFNKHYNSGVKTTTVKDED